MKNKIYGMESCSDKKGICVVCGEKVFSNQDYIRSTEGHVHQGCLK